MKKIMVLVLSLFFSLGVFSQTDMQMKKDGVMMKDGKMMVMKDGKSMMMDKEMMMKNGTTVMMDGTVKMKDGKTMMMKEGDMMDMAGKMKMHKMPKKME